MIQQSQKNNDNKAITIYDIAKEAGVSPATVSRVLSKSANVRKEKREKVQELIDKYNFKPNALAKGLAATKTMTIGIMAADVRNPYYASLFVACELLMNHLIELGHQKIALIGGRKDVLATFEKHQKYKLMLKENMIEFDEELISADGGYDFETGYERMSHMLDKNIVPTAVIAINDFSAIGVMKSIEEHGYRIPEDISVVSYDNTYMAQIATPRLTSIDYNYEEYGKKLIDTTIAMINGEKRDTLRMVTPTLVIRESSAKVRN